MEAARPLGSRWKWMSKDVHRKMSRAKSSWRPSCTSLLWDMTTNHGESWWVWIFDMPSLTAHPLLRTHWLRDQPEGEGYSHEFSPRKWGPFSNNIWDVIWYHHIWACQKIGHPEFQWTIIIFPIKIAFFLGSFILRHAQISYYWLNKSHSIPTKIPIKSSLNPMKCHTITIQTWLVVGPYPSEKLWSSSNGIFWNSQVFVESHSKFHGSSHHQPETIIFSGEGLIFDAGDHRFFVQINRLGKPIGDAWSRNLAGDVPIQCGAPNNP